MHRGALRQPGRLAVVLHQGLQRHARAEPQHHLRRGTEEHQALHHGRHPVVPGGAVGLDPDPLGADHRVGGAEAVDLAPLGHQARLTDLDVAACPRAALHHVDLHQVGHPQEVGHVGVAGLLVHLARHADLHDPAGVHHRQPVGHGQRFLLVVGDVEERDADPLLQRLQLDLERPPQLGVQRAERLVEQQHRGVEHQRPGQRHPLLLAAGQHAGAPLGVLGHLHQVQRLADLLADLGLGQAAVAQAERHVVEHVQEREQRVALEHRVDVAPVRRDAGHVRAVQQDLPGGRLLEARDQPQGGGLATAGRAEQREELPAGHRQVNAVHRDLGEALGQRDQLDLPSSHRATSLG